MTKHIVSKWAVVATTALLVGCQYDYPLVEQSVKPIDKSLLGVWESVPEAGETNAPINRALVLRFSDTEYLIQYPVKEKDSLFFRAYPIEVGGMSCLQVQVLGTEKGPVESSADTYDVVTYRKAGDLLEVDILNPQVVKKEAGSTEVLQQAFQKAQTDSARFTHLARFKKR